MNLTIGPGDIEDALGDSLVNTRFDLPIGDGNDQDEIRVIVHRCRMLAIDTRTGTTWEIEVVAKHQAGFDGRGILRERGVRL